jgi:hypothetical protein
MVVPYTEDTSDMEANPLAKSLDTSMSRYKEPRDSSSEPSPCHYPVHFVFSSSFLIPLAKPLTEMNSVYQSNDYVNPERWYARINLK